MIWDRRKVIGREEFNGIERLKKRRIQGEELCVEI